MTEYMNIAEFREHGYVHEVNRLVLHPLGLALEVQRASCPDCESEKRDDCATCGGTGAVERLGGVWDHRGDPEGIYFAEEALSPEKAQQVCDELFARRGERIKQLGWVVQPIPGRRVLTTNYTNPDDAAP